MPVWSKSRFCKFGILETNNSTFSTVNQFPESFKFLNDLMFCKRKKSINFLLKTRLKIIQSQTASKLQGYKVVFNSAHWSRMKLSFKKSKIQSCSENKILLITFVKDILKHTETLVFVKTLKITPLSTLSN